jgi:predicted dehydrogenase
MIDAAQRHDTVLALSENLRWAPSTRACRWLIEEGYIGDVEVIFQGSYGIFHLGKLWKGDEITATPWRHDKLKGGAGYVLDAGAHTAHVFRYINGEIEEAFGAIRRFTDVRTGRAYRFRQFGEAKLEAVGRPEHTENTVEDLALSVLTFANGSLGQYATGTGGHGAASHYGMWIYGSKGCVQGGKMHLDDGIEEPVVDFFRKKADGAMQERFFPRGLTNLFALESYDFFQAVQAQRSPETDGWQGLKDIAVCYSIVESALLNRPVKVSDVESGEIAFYQREINEYYGI